MNDFWDVVEWTTRRTGLPSNEAAGLLIGGTLLLATVIFALIYYPVSRLLS